MMEEHELAFVDLVFDGKNAKFQKCEGIWAGVRDLHSAFKVFELYCL